MATETLFIPDDISRLQLTPENTCFMPVDVELPFFFDDDVSDKTARKINSLASAMHADNIPVYAVYFGSSIDSAEMREHRFHPEARDHVILKNEASAFPDAAVHKDKNNIGNIVDIFNQRGIKNIIICGGWLDGCVRATIREGLKHKFNFILVSNLTTNGHHEYGSAEENRSKTELQEMGVFAAPAAAVVRVIRAQF